jgi:hypothetical protein
MTTANDVPLEAVEAVRAELDAAWRRYGIRLADRQEMAEDIVADLRAGAAEGLDPHAMIGADVDTFARQVCDARGVRPLEPAYGRMLLGGLLGAVLALVVGSTPAQAALDFPPAGQRSDRDQWIWALLAYGSLAVACTAAALAGVALALRGLGGVRATLWRAALLLPVAGVVITPLTMLFAAGTGYDTTTSTVLLETGMVLGACAAAAAAARRWALRAIQNQ